MIQCLVAAEEECDEDMGSVDGDDGIVLSRARGRKEEGLGCDDDKDGDAVYIYGCELRLLIHGFLSPFRRFSKKINK